ncbi:uncharacterized protein [Clytia hemisphaerica]|uniref:Uncharacterized protein n=1 Tax=Clytia hemisphaerica TaxID=252671 RepID=A0A7M5X4H8_9CNID
MSYLRSSSRTQTTETTRTTLRLRIPVENDEIEEFDAEELERTYLTNVYRYSRPLKNLKKLQLQGSVFMHWGVVIHYLEKDEEEGLPARFIYEANEDDGLLWARCRRFKEEDEKIANSSLQLVEEHVQISKKEAEDFCHIFNQRALKYDLSHQNCQEFVNEMLTNLSLAPKYTFRRVYDAATNSSRSLYISSGKVTANIVKAFLRCPKKEWCINIFTKLGFGQEVVEKMANELMQNTLYKTLEGAFNWYQLFQYFAEFLVRELGFYFLQKYKFDPETCHASAFVSGKIASLATATAVGSLTMGFAPALLFWFCAEIITQIISEAARYYLGDSYPTLFGGDSDYIRFFNVCHQVYIPWFEKKCQDLWEQFRHV